MAESKDQAPGGPNDTNSLQAPDMQAQGDSGGMTQEQIATDPSPKEQSPGNPSRRATKAKNAPSNLWVTGAIADKVGLWERDPLHPDGEITVVGDGRAYEVGDTAGVRVALRDGRLKELSDSEASKANDDYAEAVAKRRADALASGA